MTETTTIGNLQVDRQLADFIANEVAPGTGIEASRFWAGYQTLLDDLEPENKKLLAERDALQAHIDDWNRASAGMPFDVAEQRKFLEKIGYIIPEGADFAIETTDVDPEIATLAGPQLVVPVINARFALNAANARWGSLYDALYGTDAIPEIDGSEKRQDYNPVRGANVIAWVRAFLDNSISLSGASWMEVTTLLVANSKLTATVQDGRTATLADVGQFVGYVGNPAAPTSLLFKSHGLHIEILIDPTTVIGRSDLANISDVWLESALTTIQDCEDSVAAVDAADKITVYRNWLGLMKGDLQEEVSKDGKIFIRKLSADRSFTAPTGENFTLPGRSLMLVRNVGHLMTTDAVKRKNGSETPEGFLDAMVTTFCGLHDLGTGRNSRKNSIYIVKPKMHGPKEAALANAIFDRVEDVLNLPRHTIKVGVMDEERRTSINLKETIRAVKGRLAFINTGFLDRTGDEIHTNMLAGPVVRKNEIKSTRWLDAYERNNVDVGLKAGLAGKAQIGKGMWAKPDAMAEMLEVKIGHSKSGANTAWVPSRTAATLHATHYHGLDVAATQKSIMERVKAKLDDILTPPLLAGRNLSVEEVRRELNNNAQSILGYVVRWVDQGIGCSKVPDIDDVALMEDRATLRISAQHLANWLKHGICTAEEVEETLARMAAVVDRQNVGDSLYRPMASDFDASVAIQAARDLVFEGMYQPNGYTEPILHRRRREAKAKFAR